MRRFINLNIYVLFALFSCNANKKSATQASIAGTADTILQTKNITNRFIFTQHEYAIVDTNGIIIQNSLPKGGLQYMDPNGKPYIYAVFWTRILNETDYPIEVTVDFAMDSFEIPVASGNYMKLLVPSDTMYSDEESMFNYGLAVNPFLDKYRNKNSLVNFTINAKKSHAINVVALSTHGVNGTLRSELILRNQQLFYTVNGIEMYCGRIIMQK